jgi:anti-anti-sigma factor
MLAQTEGRFDGPLTIKRTRYGDDILVFSLSGELDLGVTGAAREILGSALAEPCAMVVIDLTELEFLGVKGVALLYELARSRPDKDSLRLLSSCHEGVNRVLEMTGVSSVIPTVPS